jgi:hypothetical protein
MSLFSASKTPHTVHTTRIIYIMNIDPQEHLPTYEAAIARNPLPLIAPYLCPKDLFSATLVSHRWHAAFSEELWRAPDRLWEIGDQPVLSIHSSILFTLKAPLTKQHSEIPPLPPYTINFTRKLPASSSSFASQRPAISLHYPPKSLAAHTAIKAPRVAELEALGIPVL